MSQIKAWEPQADGPGSYADEAALVAGLRAGRQEAFEALHGAYAASIYGLALRIVDDPHEAQDVAQEVLIKVFRALPGKETDLNLPAWLYRVTVNAAFDQVRARKRRPVTVVDDAAPESAAVVDEFERAELSRRVETTLRELPKRQQLALVLRDVHGLSVGETASVLGLTKGSADVLLSRARAGFRRIFLTGAGSLRGRCHEADMALAAGVGRGEGVPAALLDHSRTCPECRRAVEFWGAAPVGLALLLPQVVLPAKLSLGATLAAAQAAGVAVSAATGGAAAAGASAAGGAAASASTAAGSAAGGTAAAASAGGGLLAGLGSAAGHQDRDARRRGHDGPRCHRRGDLPQRALGPEPADTPAVALEQSDHGAGAGRAEGTGSQAAARARLLARAHRDGLAAHDGANGRAGAAPGSAGQGARGDAAGASQTGAGSRSGGSSGGQSSSPGGLRTGERRHGRGAGDSSAGGGSGSGAGGQGGEAGGGLGGSSGTGGDTGGGTGGAGGDADSGAGGGLGGGTLSPQ